MKALTLSEFGSSDVLEYKEISDPVLKDGEILVEMKAIGLNFADIMRRKGDYPMRGQSPFINGYEGAGIVKDSNHHPAFSARRPGCLCRCALCQCGVGCGSLGTCDPPP